MGVWAEIKHAMNSTLGTEIFLPLDKFVSRPVLCRGILGTTFVFTAKEACYKNFSITLDSSDKVGADGYLERYINIHSNAAYDVEVRNKIGTAKTSVGIPTSGFDLRTVKITYSIISNAVIATITSDTDFVVPEGVESLVFDAAGGGGGGGGTSPSKSSSSYYPSAAAGGGGYNTSQKQLSFACKPGDVIPIIIGTGGNGGLKSTSSSTTAEKGKQGNATRIGNIASIPGGSGGEPGGTSISDDNIKYKPGKGGKTGGSDGVQTEGGEGGVSPIGYGNGGKGADGGRYYGDGEAGTNGVVIFYKGVVIK